MELDTRGLLARLSNIKSKEDFPKKFIEIGQKCIEEGLRVRRIGWERGVMSWKRGYFKENIKCLVCGRRLPELFKICDDCVLDIYLETVLIPKTLSEIAKEVGVSVKTLSWRINRMKRREDFRESSIGHISDISRKIPVMRYTVLL